ncbi:MAG: hypothetical protein U9O64_02990 [Campylobacterota bacterium]|nr:hypothetical protein [Campylobacterota bacterium]
MNRDEKAFYILEKAVYKAQKSLQKTKIIQPFLMLLTDSGEVEIYENKVKNLEESYGQLEEVAVKRVKLKDVDILVLVCEALTPKQISQHASHSIRIHLEEKSQIDKKIGARFLYVPYELSLMDEEVSSVHLYQPIPVGFPAVFIV